MAATAAVLRASAATLEGRSEPPDFGRLEAARDAVAGALAAARPSCHADDDLESALEPPFRIRVLSYSARQVAGYALQSTGAGTAREALAVDASSSPSSTPAGLGLVPEQRSRRRRARRRGLHRAASRPPARLLGRARDAVGPALERARHRLVDRQRPGRDGCGHRRRRGPRDRDRHPRGGALGGAAGRGPARRLRAAGDLVRRGPGGLHGRALRALQHHSAHRLEGRRRSGRGRRDRLRDQPRRRAALLAARRGERSCARTSQPPTRGARTTSSP